jgi:hypothetical protein
MRKFSGSGFIKIDHVRDGPLSETIARIVPGKYDKANAVFVSGGVLALNATSVAVLIRAYGANSDDWINKTIELYAGEIEYQGEPVPAVRVRPISPPLKPAEQTALPPSDGGDDLDSETPF